MLRIIAPFPLALVLVGAMLTGCRHAQPPAVQNVVMVAAESLPADPGDEAWATAPEYVAKLIPQDLVDPRVMNPTTAELRVRALTDGHGVALRLEWEDATQDDLSTSATFSDACGVQFPATIGPTIPAPQMGEKGKPVEISYWNAGWQAAVDGRGETLKDLYPNVTVDHYPFEAASLEPGSPDQRAMAARYAPARALGNSMAGPHKTSVQDLVAEGPGTLHPAPREISNGRGQKSEQGWSVVVSRPLPEGLAPTTQAQVAFAVWDGSHDEAGARKMRTGWITIVEATQP